MSANYCCYLLACRLSTGRMATYKGCTNNMTRRLRQHNGEIKGGARATARYKGQWRVACVVTCLSRTDALRLEWHWKHPRGPRSRVRGNDFHNHHSHLMTSISRLDLSPVSIVWDDDAAPDVVPCGGLVYESSKGL